MADLDLDAIKMTAAAVAKYHAEHARYGGVSWEFHARAQTFADVVRDEIRSLCAEVDRLRDRCLAAEAREAEAVRLLTVAAAVLGALTDPNDRVGAIKICRDDAPGLDYGGDQWTALYLPDAADQVTDAIRKHLEPKP